jgi:hypothetical protein
LTAHQDQTAPSTQDTTARQVFRSPVAIAVWWICVLFVVANLIDLAVQGRDHISAVAAVSLILGIGVAYAAVQRPRIVIDGEGLTIVNPLRDHRIGWAAVAGAEATDLVRVRCAWPAGRRTIHAWAIYSSRRRQHVAEMRVQQLTRSRRRMPGGGSAEPVESAASKIANEPNDSERVVALITSRADEARAAAAPGAQPDAQAPASTWNWPAVIAIVVPALALVIAILA